MERRWGFLQRRRLRIIRHWIYFFVASRPTICFIILTDVRVAEGYHPGALLQMGGPQHEEEGQIVVSHFQVHLIYAQDLLSKNPEIHQFFTYR